MLTAPYFISNIDVLFDVMSAETFSLNLNYILFLETKYVHDCKMKS